jgi:[ribosomal protein S18]-alanine N-acetyltransferase
MAAPQKPKHSGKPVTGAPYRIRRAVVADAPALVTLERACFGDPWSESSFREALETPWTFGLVADTESQVEGYLIGRDVAGSGEVLNLAVDPSRRRAGIARALLKEGLRTLGERGAEEVFLEVRASNSPAIELYRASGFRPVGIRADYYRNPREDAMVLRLGLKGLA